MIIIELFVPYIFGLILLTLSSLVVPISDKLFNKLFFSSVASFFLLCFFGVIGFKPFAFSPLSCLLTGYLGIINIILVIVLNLI
ncbi:MAG: hypothetical protein RR107_07125 [Clostridia bacterium]